MAAQSAGVDPVVVASISCLRRRLAASPSSPCSVLIPLFVQDTPDIVVYTPIGGTDSKACRVKMNMTTCLRVSGAGERRLMPLSRNRVA